MGTRKLAEWECAVLDVVHKLHHAALVSHTMTVSHRYMGSVVLVHIKCKTD